MLSPVGPQKPESRPAGRVAFRRAFTVPPKLATPTKPPPVEIGAADGIETLYVHSAARVVSFSSSRRTSTRASSSSSRAIAGPEQDALGTLPWATSTERTLAAGIFARYCGLKNIGLTRRTGPLEIYRVPGSVSFLHSGALLHAILPRSQCWCVDGVSKFVFRVLPETYYRIELPGETEEDMVQVERLKITLQKVLHYERTACPFKRGFTVDLPDSPQKTAQRKKRPMTGPAKKWKLDRVWRPEDGPDRGSRNSPSSSPSPCPSEEDGEDGEEEPAQVSTEAGPEELRDKSSAQDVVDKPNLHTSMHLRPANLSLRSVTAPPQFNIQPVSPPNILPPPDSDTFNGDIGIIAVEKSVPHLPSTFCMPPTPESMREADVAACDDAASSTEFETAGDEADDDDGPGQQAFDPPSTIQSEDDRDDETDQDDPFQDATSSSHAAPGILTTEEESDSETTCWHDFETPPETFRLRRRIYTTNTQRSKSPEPQPARIYRSASSDSRRAVAEVLVRQTCAILLSPPSHLVAVMLRIAAKLATKAFAYTIQSPEHSLKRVPGSWDLSDEDDDWDIDDYGFPLGRSAGKTAGGGHANSALGVVHTIDEE